MVLFFRRLNGILAQEFKFCTEMISVASVTFSPVYGKNCFDPKRNMIKSLLVAEPHFPTGAYK